MGKIQNVIVYDVAERKTEKVKVQNSLLWYDSDNQEMLTFSGGALDLVNTIFDKDLNRSVPKIIDVFRSETRVIKSRKAVADWFSRYSNYNITNAEISDLVEEGTLLAVPSEELDDLLYDLERNGIHFRIE